MGSAGNSRAVSTSNSPSSSGKVRSSKHKHTSPTITINSNNTNPNTTAPSSLEASVWQHTPTRNIDSIVMQDLVSTETITAQASAGARVLVQQANTYESHRGQKSRKRMGSEVVSSGSSSVGGGGAASSGAGGGAGGASGKARSVRINNTIPVRAVSGTGASASASAANHTGGGGIVATTPPRKADHTKSAKKDGCVIG